MTEVERQATRQVIMVAELMAQELQEFVDDAITAEGDEGALGATQELLGDFDKAMQALRLAEGG